MSKSLQLLCQYDSDNEDRIDNQNDIASFNQQHIQDEVKLLLDSLCNDIASKVDAERFSTYRTTCDEHELHLSSSSSECDSSSTSSWSLSSDSDNESMNHDEHSPTKSKHVKAPKTKGELDLDDLPPIEHLDINVTTEHLIHFGRVVTIVDRLVSVLSFKNMPALDLDSVLFMKCGRPLGTVFDVFGPVSQPIYVVRFNSEQEITAYSISVDMPVYFVPTLGDPLTKFVFVNQLMQEKGSDASWEHNNEPPDECRDFSDDEQEKMAKNNASKKRTHSNAK